MFAETLERSTFLSLTLKLSLFATLVITSLRSGAIHMITHDRFVNDYNAFYLAGKLALDGQISLAYHFKEMDQALRQFYGGDVSMPWSYPPPFDLVVSLLALFPIGASSFLFSGFALVFYFQLTNLLAKEHRRLLAFILLPVLFLNLISGQNGLLTGSLLASFCYLRLKDNPWAGIPLGLMIIKPHLALGFALHVTCQRRGKTLWIAALTAAILATVSTYAFGVGVWRDFAEGIQEATSFLKGGNYPLVRMTSVFAETYTLSGNLAFGQAAQIISLLMASAGTIYITFLHIPETQKLGLIGLLTPFFSPYFYDYDLPVVGVGLALLFPTLRNQLPPLCRLLALTSFVLAESGWKIMSSLSQITSTQETPLAVYIEHLPSLASSFLLITLILISKGVFDAWKAQSIPHD